MLVPDTNKAGRKTGDQTGTSHVYHGQTGTSLVTLIQHAAVIDNAVKGLHPGPPYSPKEKSKSAMSPVARPSTFLGVLA